MCRPAATNANTGGGSTGGGARSGGGNSAGGGARKVEVDVKILMTGSRGDLWVV